MQIRRWLQAHFRTLLVLSLVVAQLGLATLTGVLVNDNVTRITDRQERALVESCVRLNIERAKTNLADEANYRVDNVVVTLAGTLERLTGHERLFSQRLLAEMTFAVSSERWTPLTDCAKAVNAQGAAYRPPRPILFKVKLPPASALKY